MRVKEFIYSALLWTLDPHAWSFEASNKQIQDIQKVNESLKFENFILPQVSNKSSAPAITFWY